MLGILNKEHELNRSWCPMYGYTEITPGRIRVDKIISADGKTYFDLANSVIGGHINFVDGVISENVDMTNAIIRGKIISNVIELTQENFNEYMIENPIENMSGKIIDYNRLLGVKTTIIVKYQPQQTALYLPGTNYNLDTLYKSPLNEFCNLDDFIGNRIRIINQSNYPFGIGFTIKNEYGQPIGATISPGKEMCIECIINELAENKKEVFWEIKYWGNIADYN